MRINDRHKFPVLSGGAAGNKVSPVPLVLISEKTFSAWVKKQGATAKNWLSANGFVGKVNSFLLIPDKAGKIVQVVAGVEEPLNIWSIAHLFPKLPALAYDVIFQLDNIPPPEVVNEVVLGWALAGYDFSRYKSKAPKKQFAVLLAPDAVDIEFVKTQFDAICWARDLINTPADDMNPEAFAAEAVAWAKASKAKFSVIKGAELQEKNYPMIYAVGKAADIPPHLVDIRFPRKNAPKITIVGKGVTFDSGGLDIKSSGTMKLMKKDMGGAASALALAKIIIAMGLRVQLRVLLPIVENAVSGNAMRPLDIVKTRKGISVEIGNTDAEGRLILCDALFEADSECPDMLIDFATLTGAARVALGAEIPAFFTNSDSFAHEVYRACRRTHDPMWRLPLWKGYREQLDTVNADLSNDPDSSYGGAITAALYLQEFISNTPLWIHVDMMAWNLKARAGRPLGGEAMAVRAIYSLIKEKYGSSR